MPGRFLLDTNAVIALRDSAPGVVSLVASADSVWDSVVSIGEMFYGTWKSAQPERNRQRFESAIAGCAIAHCSVLTATSCASVRDGIRRKGRPIPDNDIRIAATAIQHDLVLVTRDAHFDHIDGLSVQTW
ncbi:MAG TPA: type II toxin-antitoxin system VapC family toxin [Armatimonadota bacterium]